MRLSCLYFSFLARGILVGGDVMEKACRAWRLRGLSLPEGGVACGNKACNREMSLLLTSPFGGDWGGVRGSTPPILLHAGLQVEMIHGLFAGCLLGLGSSPGQFLGLSRELINS